MIDGFEQPGASPKPKPGALDVATSCTPAITVLLSPPAECKQIHSPPDSPKQPKPHLLRMRSNSDPGKIASLPMLRVVETAGDVEGLCGRASSAPKAASRSASPSVPVSLPPAPATPRSRPSGKNLPPPVWHMGDGDQEESDARLQSSSSQGLAQPTKRRSFTRSTLSIPQQARARSLSPQVGSECRRSSKQSSLSIPQQARARSSSPQVMGGSADDSPIRRISRHTVTEILDDDLSYGIQVERVSPRAVSPHAVAPSLQHALQAQRDLLEVCEASPRAKAEPEKPRRGSDDAPIEDAAIVIQAAWRNKQVRGTTATAKHAQFEATPRTSNDNESEESTRKPSESEGCRPSDDQGVDTSGSVLRNQAATLSSSQTKELLTPADWKRPALSPANTAMPQGFLTPAPTPSPTPAALSRWGGKTGQATMPVTPVKIDSKFPAKLASSAQAAMKEDPIAKPSGVQTDLSVDGTSITKLQEQARETELEIMSNHTSNKTDTFVPNGAEQLAEQPAPAQQLTEPGHEIINFATDRLSKESIRSAEDSRSKHTVAVGLQNQDRRGLLEPPPSNPPYKLETIAPQSRERQTALAPARLEDLFIDSIHSSQDDTGRTAAYNDRVQANPSEDRCQTPSNWRSSWKAEPSAKTSFSATSSPKSSQRPIDGGAACMICVATCGLTGMALVLVCLAWVSTTT